MYSVKNPYIAKMMTYMFSSFSYIEIATNDRILAQYDDGHYKAEAQVLDEVDGRTHVLYTLTISE